ncbi:MAG: outer membrane beta-barrel protein [Elusimicrobiaceae bacterium]|nr:outer membrane beta-barrel protein [Elusimicrobiaceae bacterium]
MRKSIFFAFVLVCLSVLTLNASDLRFMAYEGLSYDDNIYLTNDNRIGSAISSTKLGALYDLAIPNSSLKGKFTAVGGYNAYQKHNHKNGFWDALVIADFGNDLFKIGDTFLLTSDPANSEITEREQRINNKVYASYRTSAYKKLSLGFKVSDEYEKYISGTTLKDLNRNRVNAGAGIYFNVSEKTSLFAEYTFTALSYDTNHANNSIGGTAALGIEGKIAPKVTGEAKVTYDYRNYTHDKAGCDNYGDLIGYNVEVSWEPTSRTLFRLSGARKFEETLYVNNRYFISTGVELYGSQKILEKLTAGLTLGYENLSYPKDNGAGVERSDDVFTVRPEIGYQFNKWLSAGVWYQYRRRASNAGDVNYYYNNRAGAFVRAIF